MSEDSIVGSDQKGEIFYRSIAEHYDATKPAWCSGRTVKSVERRMRKLLTECLSFAACVARVSNAQPSGTTSDDVLHLATALHNKLEITSVTESCGAPFKYFSCWKLLKDHPKFDLLLHPPPPPATPEPPAATADGYDGDATEEGDGSEASNAEQFRRPMGRKRAKASEEKSELAAKRLKIAKETLETQKKRNELLLQQQEMLLFTSPVDNSDPIAREYMEIKRRQALQRLRQQSATQSPPDTPLPQSPSAPK